MNSRGLEQVLASRGGRASFVPELCTRSSHLPSQCISTIVIARMCEGDILFVSWEHWFAMGAHVWCWCLHVAVEERSEPAAASVL
jgi:hypothetical protein